jgi:hypothetical protein
LGVEVQDDFIDELRGDHSQDQKGHTGGPTQKKDKNCYHLPYGGSSSQSRTSGAGYGGGSTQLCAIAKPGLGLVCFCCGDVHRRSDCHLSGQCSRCGKDYKEVVCRRNPNSKLIWEAVANSSSGQRGNAHMMTSAPYGIQYTTFPVHQLLPAPPMNSTCLHLPHSKSYPFLWWLRHLDLHTHLLLVVCIVTMEDLFHLVL